MRHRRVVSWLVWSVPPPNDHVDARRGLRCRRVFLVVGGTDWNRSRDRWTVVEVPKHRGMVPRFASIHSR